MRITELGHVTPSKLKFIQARHDDANTLIRFKHENSDEVLAITQGTKHPILAQGYWCTVHGGFNYTPCACTYETRIY